MAPNKFKLIQRTLTDRTAGLQFDWMNPQKQEYLGIWCYLYALKLLIINQSNWRIAAQ